MGSSRSQRTYVEVSAALDRYQRGHPGAWDRLRQAIEKAAGHPVDQLPMVDLLLDLAPTGADVPGATDEPWAPPRQEIPLNPLTQRGFDMAPVWAGRHGRLSRTE
jgi:hypothetical protein